MTEEKAPPPSKEEKEQIEDLDKKNHEEEVASLKDQLLRTLAELENLRKRSEREREEIAKYAISGFARDLLTVADNLRRALESVPPDLAEVTDTMQTLLDGVKITEKELLNTLENHGVKKVSPLGEKFDHQYHQAMFEVEDRDQPIGTIVHLLQPGYTLHDRLLRPALVGVAKDTKKNAENKDEKSES